MSDKSFLGFVGAAVAIVLLIFSIRVVDDSQTCAVVVLGKVTRPANSGLQLVAPFITAQKKQEAEQARIAAQGRADSVVIEAKAEAEALTVVATALRQNPNILQYEYIKKLAPNVSVMMVPSGQDFLYTLPAPIQ